MGQQPRVNVATFYALISTLDEFQMQATAIILYS